MTGGVTRSWRWRGWPWLGLFLLIAVTVVVLIYIFRAHDPKSAVTLVQALVGLVTPAVTVAVFLWTRRRPVHDSPSHLESAADKLAQQVSGQWKRAAAERRLMYPELIPLRWRWADLSVAGTGRGGDGTRFEPLPGIAPVTAARLQAGTLKDLLDVYGGVESGRLIILGGPGSGKTSAAIMLLREALKRRDAVGEAEARARVPVPVLLTLRGWDPNRKSLVNWLVNQLERDYEFLLAREYGSNTAAELIKGDYLTVILDGLDEIPEKLCPAALRELDGQATFPLVVVTRSKELADAVSGGHLRAAAALELCPVEPRQAAEYLASCQPDPPAPAWRCVLAHLCADPGGILAQALDTPLMVSLVRDNYSPGDPVNELLDRSRFPSRDTIEDHLLDRVLPIAYARRPDQPAPPCTADEARQRLGFLARRMNDESTRDLAWWQIPRWLPTWPRALVIALVVGLVGGLDSGLVSGCSYGLNRGLATGLAGGLCWALVFGLGSVVVKGYSQKSGWIPLRRDDTRTSLIFGLIVGLVFGLGNGIAAGLSYGPVTGLTIGLVDGLLDALLVRVSFGLLARIGEPSAKAASLIDPLALWRRERQLGLKAGLVFGLTGGLTGGLENVIDYGYIFTVEIKAIPLVALGGCSSVSRSDSESRWCLRRHGRLRLRTRSCDATERYLCGFWISLKTRVRAGFYGASARCISSATPGSRTGSLKSVKCLSPRVPLAPRSPRSFQD